MAGRSARAGARIVGLAGLAAFGVFSCREPDRPWPPGPPRTGGRVEASLAPGEVHRYRLPLRKDRLLRLVVDQQGVDAVVALEDPAGETILQVDRQSGSLGPELVLAVTATSGDYTLIISGRPESPRGRYKARVEALRPASAIDRRNAEAYRLFSGADRLPEEKADEAQRQREGALRTWRQTGEVALQAEALERIANQIRSPDRYLLAVDPLRQAADAFRATGDPLWEGITRLELGGSLLALGEAEEAAAQFKLALPLTRQAKDRRNQARALQNLGQAYRNQGELQQALDRYLEALQILPEDDRAIRPYVLHNLGVLYGRYLGDPDQGTLRLGQALRSWPPDAETVPWKARTWTQLGLIAGKRGRLKEARADFQAALDLRRASDPCQAAVILAGLARVEEEQGSRGRAEDLLDSALDIVGERPCRISEPAIQLHAAGLAERSGDFEEARSRYRRARLLYSWLGDRMGLATSFAGLARSVRSLGDLPGALDANRQALAILEGVRPTVLSDELRASFFSTARPAFELQVDLLLRLGRPEEAWAAAEHARARVLVDLLAESGAGLGGNVPPDLAAREGEARRRLNALETVRSAVGERSLGKLQPILQAIDGQVAELAWVRGELRRRSPAYSALQQTEPVSLATAQRELLDADSVLLEYQLGEEASTVWMVTRKSVAFRSLPKRSEIEPHIVTALNGLKSLAGPSPNALCQLSATLLRPVLPSLGRHRLVVVADGALEQLPFGALPLPEGARGCSSTPLVDSHEIAYLPSMSALASQRRLLAGRPPAPGWLAVMADPVYESSDPRLPATLRRTAPDSEAAFQRLPSSAREADSITAALPARKVRVSLGFDATRKSVVEGALRGFRILHFATHGLLNTEQPMLSALVLSRYDASRNGIDGFLTAHEIYGLDLPAELVVLSACETALGHEVAGEGLVSGLPRAFLSAGAARVLVSLWPVQDRSAGDLMARFYDGLLHQGLGPARALQEAQRSMAREGSAPLNWAGFILLGDWRPLPPFRE